MEWVKVNTVSRSRLEGGREGHSLWESLPSLEAVLLLFPVVEYLVLKHIKFLFLSSFSFRGAGKERANKLLHSIRLYCMANPRLVSFLLERERSESEGSGKDSWSSVQIHSWHRVLSVDRIEKVKEKRKERKEQRAESAAGELSLRKNLSLAKASKWPCRQYRFAKGREHTQIETHSVRSDQDRPHTKFQNPLQSHIVLLLLLYNCFRFPCLVSSFSSVWPSVEKKFKWTESWGSDFQIASLDFSSSWKYWFSSSQFPRIKNNIQ